MIGEFVKTRRVSLSKNQFKTTLGTF